jgi:hypothetical protein
MFEGSLNVIFGNFSVPFKTVGKLIVPAENQSK